MDTARHRKHNHFPRNSYKLQLMKVLPERESLNKENPEQMHISQHVRVCSQDTLMSNEVIDCDWAHCLIWLVSCRADVP